MPKRRKPQTAADMVLLAVSGLVDSGIDEFSEWKITAAAWLLDYERFGMVGFERCYPDHKRTYTEILKIAGPRFGWLMKTRKNHYCLTAAGLRAASKVRAVQEAQKQGEGSN